MFIIQELSRDYVGIVFPYSLLTTSKYRAVNKQSHFEVCLRYPIPELDKDARTL